jgi:hypothetical protein
MVHKNIPGYCPFNTDLLVDGGGAGEDGHLLEALARGHPHPQQVRPNLTSNNKYKKNKCCESGSQVFRPLGSETVIIRTDPDTDPSIIEQKKQEKP